MKKKILALLFIVLLLLSACAPGSNQPMDTNLLKNGSFEASAEGVQDWFLERYDTSGDTTSYGTVVLADAPDGSTVLKIESLEFNDARFVQTVAVARNSYYCLSAMVKTEFIAPFSDSVESGANLSFMNTYCHSEYVTADKDWTQITVYGKTGASTREVSVALRLGYYSADCKGCAYFDNVSLTRIKELPKGVYAASMDAFTSSTDNDDKEKGVGGIELEIILRAVLYFAVLAGGLYLLIKKKLLSEKTAYIIILAALAVRLIASVMYVGFKVDINCFTAWGKHMANVGPLGFYSENYFCDYPPLYMMVLGLISSIFSSVSLSSGIGLMLLKLPAVVCDILAAVLIIKIAKKHLSKSLALALGVAYALLPTAILNSAIWGQVDSILVLFMLLTFWLIDEDKFGLSVIVFFIGMLFKPQAVLFGPVMLLAALREFIIIFKNFDSDTKDSLMRLAKGFGGLLGGGVIFVGLSILMQNGQSASWLFDKYMNTLGSYDYATLSSFGFMGLLGGQWAPSGQISVLGLSYSTLGTIGVVLSVVLGVLLFALAIKKSKGIVSTHWFWIISALVLAGAVVFSTRTHERYIFPVIIMLLMGFVHFKDFRLVAIAAGYGLLNFINTACVLYIYEDLAVYMSSDDAVFVIGSLLTVLLFVYQAFVSFELLKDKAPKLPAFIESNGDGKGSANKAFSKTESSAQGDSETINGLSKKTSRELLALEARRGFKFPKVTLKDVLICLLITAIYACVAFTNLGDTKAAETQWHPDSAGTTATLDLGSEQTFDGFSYNSLQPNGSFEVYISSDGSNFSRYNYCNVTSANGWTDIQKPATARYVRIKALSALSLGEVAVIRNGAPVEIASITHSVMPSDTATLRAEALIDAQDSYVPSSAQSATPWQNGGNYIVTFASPVSISSVQGFVTYSEGSSVAFAVPSNAVAGADTSSPWTDIVALVPPAGTNALYDGEFIVGTDYIQSVDRVLVKGSDAIYLTSVTFYDGNTAVPVSAVYKEDNTPLDPNTPEYLCFASTSIQAGSCGEAWRTTSSSDYVIADFGAVKNIDRSYYFTSVCTGTFGVTFSEDGVNWFGNQTYNVEAGNLYYWRQMSHDISARYVMISTGSTSLRLIEIGFFETEDATTPIEIVNVTAFNQGEKGGANIFDEQDLVPYEGATYMNSMYFDEIYHARTAYESANGLSIYEWTHPPLGKDIISWCVSLMGMNPFAWRFAGTLAGVLMIPAIYFLALLLFRKTAWATGAALLMALDGMHFVQTRIATIDSYGVLFIILMFLFMYWYYSISFYDTPLLKTFIPLGLCGLSFGLGAASKWICLYAGAGLAVIFFITVYRRYCEYLVAKKALKVATGERKKYLEHVTATFVTNTCYTLLFCVLVFIIIPLIIYCASYYPYWNAAGETRPWYKIILDNQSAMFNYHSKLEATHSYQSDWYTWPVMYLPMFFYSGPSTSTTMSAIYSFGNPAVWYSGLICTLSAIFVFVKRIIGAKLPESKAAASGIWSVFSPNDDDLSDKGERDFRLLMFLVLGLACNLLPWVGISRCIFIYHYFASVPFIILFTIYALRHISRKNPKLAAGLLVGLIVFALVLFIMFLPIWSGTSVSRDYVNTYLRWLPSWFKAWF